MAIISARITIRKNMSTIAQSPIGKLPIYIIGAGGIVNEAHLPAYCMAGFNVQGTFDIVYAKAKATAEKFSIPHSFATLEELLSHSTANCVYDIAVPGDQLTSILKQLPSESSVLMQKPMGENYDEAKKILEIIRAKKMIAAVNFQLRYAPYILAAKDLINKNEIGEINDIEVNVNVYTPWHLWNFLFTSCLLYTSD